MKYFTIIIIALFFVSCYPPGIRSEYIPVEEIYGTYDLSRGKTITFLRDSTYTYSYPDSCGVMKTEIGVWYYWYSPNNRNMLHSFDMRAVLETGERQYWTEYSTFHLYVCKYWGKMLITQGWEGDPDGSPIHWFHKIK